ncbi:aspartate/glutamate racemase family protein [Aquibacillus sediminis]|uniref:aspartate/glutamate racemase family protein n=1 Tax=Aquibacillus sediminis TaxID=2574734 RepID=UPI00110994E5|nr:amino acid racemase [Aquibacillus sediminis]
MEKNSLGVIGGMGPKATSVFFDKVIDYTDADKDQDHINMVILNHATLPDRTKVILNGEETQFLDEIKSDINLLESAGVANIAIPCNTSHYFYDQMQTLTTIPIINMVDETVRYIAETFGINSKVGILATNGTIRTRIYERACNNHQLNLHVPDDQLQNQIMGIIYNDIKSGTGVNITVIEEIINHLISKEACDCVILACTEFSVVSLSEQVNKYCVDAMNILVQESIRRSV